MITLYRTGAFYSSTVTKNCDENNCCKELSLKIAMQIGATDLTDFNPGDEFPVYIGKYRFMVSDDVVRTRPCVGTSFQIWARRIINQERKSKCK